MGFDFDQKTYCRLHSTYYLLIFGPDLLGKIEKNLRQGAIAPPSPKSATASRTAHLLWLLSFVIYYTLLRSFVCPVLTPQPIKSIRQNWSTTNAINKRQHYTVKRSKSMRLLCISFSGINKLDH
jgi:hypothetical protein